MITIRRSDTGHYILVHEPSQTTMVGDNLESTHARLAEYLRDNPTSTTMMVSPGLNASPRSPRAAWVGLAIIALLPFLWLAVLHYTLGRIVDELRHAPAPVSADTLEPLHRELAELRQVVARVEDEVGQARAGVAPNPSRASRSRRRVGAPPALSAPIDDVSADSDAPTEREAASSSSAD